MKIARLTAALVMATLAVTACSTAASSTSSSLAPASPGAAPAARATVSPAAAPVTSAAKPPARRPSAARVTVTRVRTADGSVTTVAVFHGPVRYVLHDGSWDPYSKYSRRMKAGPVVGTAERGQLLAAFNGGFLMRSLAGGYEQEGYVFQKLDPGLASLVIDRAGRARIAVWGVTAPSPGETPYDVRQNLWPLVQNGQVTAEAALWWRWGGANSHAALDPRSAVGQNAAGQLMYAASMSATPEDLAQALARRGARIAMELDINSGGIQLDVAHTAGGALATEVPGQVRPAGQYLKGWTRDFVTVLAAS